jgi:hypothetical protein
MAQTNDREPPSAPAPQPSVNPFHFTPPVPRFQQIGNSIHAQDVFVGCPVELFELTARDPLCLALIEGLNRDSAVLEVGCGCLRVGYWFINFLNTGRYCGIEPNERMLDLGRQQVLGDLAGDKQPRFSLKDDFDFRVFETSFDFVVAFSIWSHASKRQISSMLDAFKQIAKPGAKFLASWFPPQEGISDYQGTSWVGRSHQSNQPGVVAHDPNWLIAAASSRGLGLRFFNDFTTVAQNWLIVSPRP